MGVTARATLDEIEGLAHQQKDTLRVMVHQSINEADQKKGPADTIEVALGNIGNFYCKIVARDRTKQPASTTKNRVNNSNFSSPLKKKLMSDIDSGTINRNHISDIQKVAKLNKDILTLGESVHQELIDDIKNNRGKLDDLNREDAAALAINAGLVTQPLVELWFSSIIRLAEKLNAKLCIGNLASVISLLSVEQKKQLRNVLSNLIGHAQNLIKNL